MNDFCRPKIPAEVTRVSSREMNGEMASGGKSIGKRQARTAGAGDARPRTARCRALPVRRGDGWGRLQRMSRGVARMT